LIGVVGICLECLFGKWVDRLVRHEKHNPVYEVFLIATDMCLDFRIDRFFKEARSDFSFLSGVTFVQTQILILY